MKRFFIYLVVCVLALANSSCKDTKWYHTVLPDFLPMQGYSAQPGKALGKGEDMLDNIYALKGLPQEDFLYRDEGGLYGGHDISLLMNKNVDEPILNYAVNKIEIEKSDGSTVSIENNDMINHLLQLRKNGVSEECEDRDTEPVMNTTVYFDLPCQLLWKCSVLTNEEGIVQLICFQVKENGWYAYDATAILSTELK